jgi:hypothetical protein
LCGRWDALVSVVLANIVNFFSLFCGSGEISVDRYLSLPFFPGDVDLELVALRLACLYSQHI